MKMTRNMLPLGSLKIYFDVFIKNIVLFVYVIYLSVEWAWDNAARVLFSNTLYAAGKTSQAQNSQTAF